MPISIARSLPNLARWPLPPGAKSLAESVLNGLARLLARRHSTVLERLADFAGASCLIVPHDLPYPLLLTLQAPPAAPHLRFATPADATQARATIRADMLTLLQLLEGKLDGDALFFSRDLVVEGDMEVVVALRNAVDDAGIDLVADVVSLLGPFSSPAERLARHLISLGSRLHRSAT
jgi:predicted lipid carrier protein YhbT